MAKRKWLIQCRNNKGLSRSDVVEFVGITQQYYNFIENGKRTPSPNIAIKIGKLLEFDWKRFYEKSGKA